MNDWTKLRRGLDEAATMLSDVHAVTHHELLRAVVDGQSECKPHKAHHEWRTVVNAAANHFTHFLRDGSGHGMHQLEKCAQSLCEIRNSNAVSCAEQHHHGFSNDAA